MALANGRSAPGRGPGLFRVACEHDLEGIVGTWAHGTYQTGGRTTSWLKVKTPHDTQLRDRHELFATRGADRADETGP